MKTLNLTYNLRETIERCIWFEKPEQALKSTPRLIAYILTHGMPEDTITLRKQLSNEDLEQALDEAPAGIYDPRSWAYWNLVVGRRETPPLPVRSFE